MIIQLLILPLALIGVPLFAVIAAFALYSFHTEGIDLAVVVIEMTRLSDTPLLSSLPLFIFAGTLLAESRAPERLLMLSRALLGWLPGGLSVVALLLCAVFTAFTGASGVTIFALGGLLLPSLLKDNYPENFSLGLLTSGGSLGLLFPPSLPLILYGVVAGVRIDHLFLAGLLPGLLMLMILAIYCFAKGQASHRPAGAREPAQPIMRTLRQSIWEIPLPIIIFGGIYGGVFTVSEAAAITALYVLIIEIVVHRDITLPQLPRLMTFSMTLFGGILLILAASLATTNYLIDQEIPNQVFTWSSRYITSKYTFLLVLNVFLLAVGAILDIFSALVLVVPLILPIAEAYGINLVHLGIIFLTNLQIGYCTPPVGLNLFLASYRFERPVTQLYRASLPFLLLLILTLLLITYFPFFSLYLVESMGS